MTKTMLAFVLLSLPLALCGCDRGPYDPALHRHEDASTGSHLSGADTGADPNGAMNDPSIRSNGSTAGGR